MEQSPKTALTREQLSVQIDDLIQARRNTEALELLAELENSEEKFYGIACVGQNYVEAEDLEKAQEIVYLLEQEDDSVAYAGGVLELIFNSQEGQYERNAERAEDFAFIRNVLRSMTQGRVLRWRVGDESQFLSVKEVQEMRETLTEHVGAMNGLATALIFKARAEGDDVFEVDFDVLDMNAMFWIHDIDEILVGDARAKDPEYYKREGVAREAILKHAKEFNLGKDVERLVDEYINKSTKVARFLKVVDELQAWMYMINSRRMDASNRDHNEPEAILGYKFAEEFPTAKRIVDLVQYMMLKPSFLNSDLREMHLIQEQYGTRK